MFFAASLIIPLVFSSSALGSTSIESFSAEPSYSSVAGGHPDWNVSFSLDSSTSAETAKEVAYDAPEGAGLYPSSRPRCSSTEFAMTECAPESQIGTVTVRARYEGKSEFVLGTTPVFDLEPSGRFGQLAFTIPILDVPVIAALSLPEETEYGLRLALENLPQMAPTAGINLTLWGVPAQSANNAARFPQGSPGSPPGCPASEDANCNTPTSSGAPELPFTLNPTICEIPLTAELEVRTYQDPGATTVAYAPYGPPGDRPEMFDCRQLSFNPSFYAKTTTNAAYSPTGLQLDFTDPQELSPTIPSPSELYGVLAGLPEGMSINPRAPGEHVHCSESQAELESEEPAACPPESELGNAELDLNDVPEPLAGEIYLGNPIPGLEQRLFLIAKGGGVELKEPIALSEIETGQLALELTLPQLPISAINVQLFEGRAALLRTPLDCENYPVTTAFLPWDITLGLQRSTQFINISSGPGGAPCLGEAKAISVSLSPESIPADGKSQTKATIRIADAEGAGLPEQDVKLSSSDPGDHVSEVTDNEDGTYGATITSSTTPGTATVTATDLTAKAQPSGSTRLTQAGTAPVLKPEPLPAPHPQVDFSVKPPRKDRNRRPRFTFAATMADASFSCKLDRGPYHACSSPLRLAKLSPGTHSFAVRATTAAGTGSPAVWRFRVIGHKPRHRKSHRRSVNRPR